MKKFVTMTTELTVKEHESMPKVCPKCGGEMEFLKRELIIREDFVGDKMVYKCKKCGHEISKEFPYPPEYRKYFVKNRKKEQDKQSVA